MGPGAEPPQDDLELWARLSTAMATRKARFAPTTIEARSPSAFALAWAELARDKGKTAPFKAVIPKANLAKAGVPA